MSTGTQVVEKAKSFLGWNEANGQDDYFINLFNQYSGMGLATTVAWCNIFTTVCNMLCGVGKDISPISCNCDTDKKFHENRGEYYKSRAYGGNYTPKTGDKVYYSSKHIQSDATHIGFVVSVTGNTLKAIEGNKNDAVGYRNIDLNNAYIIGYADVKYPDNAQPTVAQVIAPVIQQIVNNIKFNAHLRDLQGALNDDGFTDSNGNKLVIDGEFGSKSDSCISKVCLSTKTMGKYRNVTAWVQCRVGAKIDGLYGGNTKECVINYQKAHGLVADGIAGKLTIKTILRDMGVAC